MNRYVEIISSNVEKNRGFFGSFFIVYHFVLIFFLGIFIYSLDFDETFFGSEFLGKLSCFFFL